MNKKYIFIGLGLAVVAGVGFMIWKSKKTAPATTAKTQVAPQVSPIKIPTMVVRGAPKAIAKSIENKVSADGAVPVETIPDRSWLEKSWADVV